MQHFVKVLSAGLCALGVILSLGGRALCSQQQSSATSYAYFSMGLPAPARALPPPPQYEYAPAPAPASKVQVEEEEEVGGEYGIGEYDDGEYDGGEYGGGEYDGGENGDIEHDVHPRYSFKYGVEDHHTGDIKDQAEERDGDVVRGEYSLLQPDGRRRVVHYTASKHGGFNAVVSYVGQAVRPEDHDQNLDRHQYYNR